MADKSSTALNALRTFDRAIYRIECGLIAIVISVMTLSIFLAVFWRIFSSPEGHLENFLVSRLGDTSAAHGLAVLLKFLVFCILCVFAVRTARREQSLPRSVAIGVSVASAVYAAGYTLAYALPFGLVFSQRLALALLMWMVFLGSSMAAYKRRHIVVQAALKLVPEQLRHWHACVALLMAAAFTAFLWFVSTRYSLEMFNRWVESDFRESRFDSIAIPYWTVTLAVSVGLGLTLFRFVLQAVLVQQKLISAVPQTEEEEALAAAVEESGPPV